MPKNHRENKEAQQSKQKKGAKVAVKIEVEAESHDSPPARQAPAWLGDEDKDAAEDRRPQLQCGLCDRTPEVVLLRAGYEQGPLYQSFFHGSTLPAFNELTSRNLRQNSES